MDDDPGPKGRLELEFFADQLYAATVRLIVPYEKRARVEQIVKSLRQKHGKPEPGNEVSHPNSALEMHFKQPGGHITFLRLRSKTAPGFIKISYRSDALSREVEAHLDQLEEWVARYAPRRAQPLPRLKPSHRGAPNQGGTHRDI